MSTRSIQTRWSDVGFWHHSDIQRSACEVRLALLTGHGPGIKDVEKALTDGYTTGNGLGLGLGGARRLSNEFNIDTKVGEGTRITIARWR